MEPLKTPLLPLGGLVAGSEKKLSKPVDLEWLKDEVNAFLDMFERDTKVLDHCARHPEDIDRLEPKIRRLFAASPFFLWKGRLIEVREGSGDFSELFIILEKLLDVTSDVYEKARGLAAEVFREAKKPRPNPSFSSVDSAFFGSADFEGLTFVVGDLLRTIRFSAEYLETMTRSITRLKEYGSRS